MNKPLFILLFVHESDTKKKGLFFSYFNLMLGSKKWKGKKNRPRGELDFDI